MSAHLTLTLTLTHTVHPSIQCEYPVCLCVCVCVCVCRQTGLYSLVVVEGEDALDPLSASLGRQYDLPQDRLTLAFWFSPGEASSTLGVMYVCMYV